MRGIYIARVVEHVLTNQQVLSSNLGPVLLFTPFPPLPDRFTSLPKLFKNKSFGFIELKTSSHI